MLEVGEVVMRVRGERWFVLGELGGEGTEVGSGEV